MFYKNRLSPCATALFLSFWFGVQMQAKAEETVNSVKRDIYIGPGIIFGSKRILLYRPRGKDNGFETVEQDQNFKKVRLWILHNIYPSMNSVSAKSSNTAEYALLLSTDAHRDMGDVLAIIPLHLETLGPNFKDKITELKQIMDVPKAPAADRDKSP